MTAFILKPHMQRWYRAALSGGPGSSAAQALKGETDGLALSFVDDFFVASTGHYGSARVKDTSTPANNYNSHPFGLLTYSSPSVKLCRGPDGNLRYGAHNLCLQSEDFESPTWTKTAVTVSGGTVLETTADSVHELIQGSVTFGAGLTFELSIEVRLIGRDWLKVRLFDSGNNIGWFNLTTGELGTQNADFSSEIIPIDAGFSRVNIQFTPDSNSGSIIFGAVRGNNDNSPFVGDPTKGMQVRRVQWRRIPSDPTYLKTTSAAVYELPYEWDENGDLLGIRVEEQRTNLALWSNDFTQVAWSKTNLTATKTATGPDGVAGSASTLTATAANATALQAITSASAARITSCYIKRRTGSGNIELTQDNGSTWLPVTVTSEWTRVNLPAVTSANPTVGIRIVTSGDAVDVAYFQHEVGSFVTSPIETAGSTVTRAADNISLATSAFPWSDAQGTIYVQCQSIDDVLANVQAVQVQAASNPSQNRHFVGYDRYFVNTENVGQANIIISGGVDTNNHKIGCAFDTNDFVIVRDGTVGGTDSSGTPPSNMATLKIGSNEITTRTQYVKELIILPRRMTNTELQTLTGA